MITLMVIFLESFPAVKNIDPTYGEQHDIEQYYKAVKKEREKSSAGTPVDVIMNELSKEDAKLEDQLHNC